MNITTATLVETVASSTGAVELTFVPTRAMHHRAGQAGLVIVPGGGGKPFTFSSDAQLPTLSIATSFASGSRMKQALGALVPGDRVTLVGAFGGLPVAPAADEQVFVAQGIGITPFLSLARTASVSNATLLQVGAPHYYDEVAGRTAAAQHFAHRDGLQDAVASVVAEHPHATWSLSGRSDFVSSVAGRLRAAGVTGRRIHKAAFVGMRAAASVLTPMPAAA